MMLVLALEGSSLYSEASTNQNNFYKYYSGDVFDYATQIKKKDNDSSAYIKNNSNVYLNVVVAAAVSKDSPNSTLSYIDTNLGQTLHNVAPYRDLPLTNLVKESGYQYCYLVIMPCAYKKLTLSGSWSPDTR